MSICCVSVATTEHLGVSYSWDVHALWFGSFHPNSYRHLIPAVKFPDFEQGDICRVIGLGGWFTHGLAGYFECEPASIVSLAVFLRCALLPWAACPVQLCDSATIPTSKEPWPQSDL